MAAETATTLVVPKQDPFALRWRNQIWKFIRRKPLGAFGAAVMVVLVASAIFADIVAPYDPLAQGVGRPLVSPSADYLAGTDQFGRDIFSRLLHGARISLYVGIGATLGSIVPATIIGMASAYFQGKFDYLLQRLVDAVQAVPALILLIAMVVVLGQSITMIIIALAFRSAVVNSRIMRGAAIQIMRRDYVDAARALGAGNVRIMLRHVLPNIAAPIIIVASLGFGQFILAEASLSFLGYGVPPPHPAWGGMLASDGRQYLYAAPHMFIAPAAVLSIVVFGVNMFGDALRDVLDPRLRGAGR